MEARVTALTRCIGVLVVALAMRTEPAAALPPIQTYGKLSSTLRLNQPSQGTDTRYWTNTYEVGGTSYVYEPWFGIWQANGAVTRAETDAEESSTNDIFTGDVQVNLFHRSRFPLTAFVSLQDSRVEFDDLNDAFSDVRTLRSGITQQYQDLEHGAYYVGTLNHDVQTDLARGDRHVSDRLLVSADRRGDVHGFTGIFSVNRDTASVANASTLSTQLTGVHTYRPTPQLNVTNNANLFRIESDSDVFGVVSQLYTIGSQAEWRPAETALRLRGEVELGHEDTDIEGQPSHFDDRVRARTSARYELSEEAAVFGELGFDQRSTEDTSITTTFQSLSSTYNALPIDLAGYAYSWNAGAGLANQTSTDEAAVQTQAASLGHAVTRAWAPELGGVIPVVLSAGQDLTYENDSKDGSLIQLTHRATLSASKATTAGSSFAQIAAFDIRTFGRVETDLLSLNLLLSHNRSLTRYRSLDLVASYSYSTTGSAGDSGTEFDTASVEMRYRDAKLFDVGRLSFESRLRADVTNLVASNELDRRVDAEWDNRLYYRVGLLDVETRVAYTQADSEHNLLFLISLTRRF